MVFCSIIIPQTALELNEVLNFPRIPARVPGFVSALFASCSIILSWFWLGFRGLFPYFFGVLSMIHHFLVPARVPGFVSLLFRHFVPSSFPGSGWGSGTCLYSFGILFHHPFLVLARVPGLVSLLLWRPVHDHFLVLARVAGLVSLLFWCPVHDHFLVPARVPGFVFLPFLALCSIIFSWFWLGFRGLSLLFWPSVSSSFPQSLWFRVAFRGLFPWSCGILFHHHVLVSPGTRKGCGVCLPSVGPS